MTNRHRIWTIGFVVGGTLAGAAGAQYMIMDMVANRVIQKYQSSEVQ